MIHLILSETNLSKKLYHICLEKATAEQSEVYTESKKEADRLSRLARQKRDSQKTVQRYLQNEQAAKRKKNQLE